ncbi:MAG: helix-turn-helix domain-containing protein [Spirochaetes bacterium]|nr:helix-turn-helix domain-containing protein [Spirochaetota bacterium]MBU1079082.1 helix-turn-helix domain-containing protein [Spirochaetota bacterium]
MNGSELDGASAAAFLARLGEHIDHNINIIDREGVIIASLDPSRVGSYHDAARRLVATGAAIERVAVDPDLPSGVRPGVNLPIVRRGETIGVVGVTGEPDEVTPLAYAVKTSVESMIELEAWKEKALKHQDRKNLLQNLLLYDDDAPRSSVDALARKLGYDPSAVRIPVILAPPAGLDPPDALSAIKRVGGSGNQDLSFSTSDGTILVFKALRLPAEGFLEALSAEVGDYVDAVRSAMRCRAPAAAWVGAPQTALGRYRAAYRQALWLSERFPDPGADPVFLFDHTLEYLSSMIPRSEYVAAIDVAFGLVSPEAVRELGPSIKALADVALNGKEAAARLGVHRNTLSSRMDRVSRILGRDPRRDPKALDLLRLIIRYAELQGP